MGGLAAAPGRADPGRLARMNGEAFHRVF